MYIYSYRFICDDINIYIPHPEVLYRHHILDRIHVHILPYIYKYVNAYVYL
jgi:hypothetical protein